jgi:hypothetical protein
LADIYGLLRLRGRMMLRFRSFRQDASRREPTRPVRSIRQKRPITAFATRAMAPCGMQAGHSGLLGGCTTTVFPPGRLVAAALAGNDGSEARDLFRIAVDANQAKLLRA